jgi:ABC-type polysaccharide/polyol phosphate export permease
LRSRNYGGGTINTSTLAKASTEAPVGSLKSGFADIGRGLRSTPIWWTLTRQAIRSQYRRTYLGPWWMTIQMIIFVGGLSLLFGILLGQDLKEFVPYVTCGFIGFSWMTGMIQGGATSITGNASAIKTTPGPLSIYALRNFAGNTIQFIHDAIVIVAVIVVFQVTVTSSLLYLPLALFAIALNGIAVSLWLGPLVARYRDVGQIVTSIVRVLFFFTPVFWVASDLSNRQLVLLSGWNPLTYLLELFRTPLLGKDPSTITLIGVAIITVVNVTVGIVHCSRTRDRIAYWV